MKKATGVIILFSVFGAFPALSADANADWHVAVMRLIAKEQRYPRSAEIRGDEGTTRLRIMLSPNGTIDSVEIAASSGSAILDHEAQSVVSKIGRLPAPPAGAHRLSVPIVWRLK